MKNSRLQPQATRRGPHRHLSSRSSRSQCPDRGDRRRDCRSREGRIRPRDWAIRSWAETIRRAHAVHPVSTFRSSTRSSAAAGGANLPAPVRAGIGVTAYGVLSRGLLSGSKPKSSRDFRTYLPRFTGENLERNERLVEAIRQMATEKVRRLRSWRLPGCLPRDRPSCR